MPGIDFDVVRSRVPMVEVLRLLGFVPVYRSGVQWRGPYPMHGSRSQRSRRFSVHLGKNRYRCFGCGSLGNGLELWAAANHLSVYAAALDLCRRLGISVPRKTHW